MARITVSASNAGAQRVRELRGAGPRHHRAHHRRAGLRDARQHQGSGDGRDVARGDQVHQRRRHAGAQGGDTGQVQARERARLRAGANPGRQRRQAGDLQRDHVHRLGRRRGHHPRAVLGVVPRHPAPCRRHAGVRRLPRGGWIQDHAVGPRSGDHAEDQVVRAQLAVQPDGRGVFPRGAEGARRRAAAPSARLGARRRHLRAPGIRRHQVREHRARSSPGFSAGR